MKFIPAITAAVLFAVAAGAQAKPAKAAQQKTVAPAAVNQEIDSTREVAYVCQADIDGNGKLQDIRTSAMYGIKNGRVVVAQLKINNSTLTPGMWRDNFTAMNRFVSSDPNTRQTMWTTLPAEADKIAKVDGGKLSVAEKAGAQQSIILDNCKLDKTRTVQN